LDATTEQVYVETLLTLVGPVTDAQVVIPETPVTPQVPVADGATELGAPVTAAVKVIVVPRFALAAPAATVTVGVAFATLVVNPDVGAVAE